jgi:putative hemolysin
LGESAACRPIQVDSGGALSRRPQHIPHVLRDQALTTQPHWRRSCAGRETCERVPDTPPTLPRSPTRGSLPSDPRSWASLEEGGQAAPRTVLRLRTSGAAGAAPTPILIRTSRCVASRRDPLVSDAVAVRCPKSGGRPVQSRLSFGGASLICRTPTPRFRSSIRNADQSESAIDLRRRGVHTPDNWSSLAQMRRLPPYI